MLDENVLVFIKPQESPVISELPENINFNYGSKWVYFRNGEVIVNDETEPTIEADATCEECTSYKDSCDGEAFIPGCKYLTRTA